MRRTLYKWFWAWDFEKEEKWLNEKSAQGLQLIDVGLCRYTFEEDQQGRYQYRLEILNNHPSTAKNIAYIRFLEEMGVEHVGTLFKWIYLRRKASEGSFDLYNDLDSRINHLKRISNLFFWILLINLFALCLNLANSIQFGNTSSIVCVFVSAAMVLLLAFGIVTVSTKKGTLQKERMLRE